MFKLVYNRTRNCYKPQSGTSWPRLATIRADYLAHDTQKNVLPVCVILLNCLTPDSGPVASYGHVTSELTTVGLAP